MTEDVVGELANDALAVVPRDSRLLFEAPADLACEARIDSVLLKFAREDLATQVLDEAQMDPVLDLGKRIGVGLRFLGRRRLGEALVELHLLTLPGAAAGAFRGAGARECCRCPRDR